MKKTVLKIISTIILSSALVFNMLPMDGLAPLNIQATESQEGQQDSTVTNTCETCTDGNEDGVCDVCSGNVTYSGTCGDNATWTLNWVTGTFTVSGTGAMKNYTYNASNSTINNTEWTNYRTVIKKVVIGDEITSVGAGAFVSCENIIKVQLGAGLTEIGDGAFCFTNLQGELTIPAQVKRIGEFAFKYTYCLEKVTIPASVTEMGYGVFMGASKSMQVTYGGNCTTWASFDNKSIYGASEGNRIITVLDKSSHHPVDDGDCTTPIHCSACGDKTGDGEANHVFTNKYGSDAGNHWLICDNEGCRVTAEKTSHIYDDEYDTTCQLCEHERMVVQQGTTLNCFGCSFTNVKDVLKQINDSKFNAIQISPIQENAATSGMSFADWRNMYQVSSYKVAESGVLGTQEEFRALCTAAGDLGINVIVEVVIDTRITSSDLTADVIAYLKACIDLGADGFCFVNADTVTGLPDNFWSEVVTAAKEYAKGDLYCYGEVQDENASSFAGIMSVTSSYAQKVRDEVVVLKNPASYSSYASENLSIPANRTVIRMESREEFMNNTSSSISAGDIGRTWALTVPQKDIMGVYFVRPESSEAAIGSCAVVACIGDAGSPKENINAVNVFNAYFAECESEYASSYVNGTDTSVAILERGTMGAVLVEFTGSTKKINVPVHTMLVSGISYYYDTANGRHRYTVEEDDVKREKSLCGAEVIEAYDTMVIYTYTQLRPCKHENGHGIGGYCGLCNLKPGHDYKGGACVVCSKPWTGKVVYFDNSVTNWQQVNCYAWIFDKEMDWPGKEMRYDSEKQLYTYELQYTENASYDNIIFNNGGNGEQTVDITYFEGCKVYACTGEKDSDSNKYNFKILREQHNFTYKVIDETTRASAANCGNNEKYYYTCMDCGAISKTDTFEIENTATGTHVDADNDCHCDTCETIIEGKVSLHGRSITLGGDIGVNFYVEIAPEVAANETAYMLFNVNGTTTKIMVNGMENVQMEDGKICYKFSCNVSAAQMTDIITADFYLNAQVLYRYTYSVKEYTDEIIANEETYGAEAVALVKAMLNYGAKAQTHFQYNVSNLANADLIPDEQVVTSLDGINFTPYAKLAVGTLEGITHTSSSTLLNSKTTIRHYFELGEGRDISDYTFKIGETVLTPIEKNGRYYVDIKEVAADKYDQMYELVIGQGENTMSIQFSVLTYISMVLATEDMPETAKEVVNAAYWYHKTTVSYINKVTGSTN